MAGLPATKSKLAEIRDAQDQDPILSQVKDYAANLWPCNLPEDSPLHSYRIHANSMSVAAGLLLNGTAVVIPSKLRAQMLQRIHNGHLGILKCQNRARGSLWWPSITKDIENTVQKCGMCSKYRKDQAAPLIPSEIPK